MDDAEVRKFLIIEVLPAEDDSETYMVSGPGVGTMHEMGEGVVEQIFQGRELTMKEVKDRAEVCPHRVLVIWYTREGGIESEEWA